MKTVIHGRAAHHGHDEFSLSVFLGLALLFALLAAAVLIAAGAIFELSALLADKRPAVILFSLLVGLFTAGALTDRRCPRD